MTKWKNLADLKPKDFTPSNSKKKTKGKKPLSAVECLREYGAEARSYMRVQKDEERRADERGFGTTRQAEALYQKYREQLMRILNADKVYARRLKYVWAAFEDVTVEDLAERLVKLGLTVTQASSIGPDRKGVKDAKLVYLWLGDKLSQHRQRKDPELELRIGAWVADKLLKLKPPIFGLDSAKVLVLLRTESLDYFFRHVIERAAFNNPYLLPPTEKSAPWTGVRQGPLGSQLPLVSRRYSQEAVQQTIDSGEMRRVLEAVNALQDVWFVINEPVLNIAKQLPPEISPPPHRKDTSDEARKQRQRFRRSWRKIHDYNADLELIDIVVDRGQFNVLHDMDFRGRVYGVPHINYQRADHIRGLFLYAVGERLGNDGLTWLMPGRSKISDNYAIFSDGRQLRVVRFDKSWISANSEDVQYEFNRADGTLTYAGSTTKDNVTTTIVGSGRCENASTIE